MSSFFIPLADLLQKYDLSGDEVEVQDLMELWMGAKERLEHSRKALHQAVLDKFVSQNSRDLVSEFLQGALNKPETVPYFESMLLISSFYYNWLEYQGPNLSELEREDLGLSLIYGAIGYKLLDIFLDEPDSQGSLQGAQSVYLAKYLIATQEAQLAHFFGRLKGFRGMMERCQRPYIEMGMKEQQARFKDCPVTMEESFLLGHKSSPLFAYVGLVLIEQGREEVVSDYEEMFYLIASGIQLGDDIGDLRKDLQSGNITLMGEVIDMRLRTREVLQSDEKREVLIKENSEVLEKRRQELMDFSAKNFQRAGRLASKHGDQVFELVIVLRQIFQSQYY